MAIDPNDLLIFKKRQRMGQPKSVQVQQQPAKSVPVQETELPVPVRNNELVVKTVPVRPAAQKPAATPKPAPPPNASAESESKEDANADYYYVLKEQPEAPGSRNADKSETAENLKKQAQKEQQVAVQPSTKPNIPINAPAAQPSARLNIRPNAQPAPEQHIITQQTTPVSTYVPSDSEPEEDQADVKRSRKFTKLEKKNIDAAKGYNCTIHPWRKAYATCELCKRQFCYADLIDYMGAPYCIEDINEVSREHGGEINYWNFFTYLASAFILCNATLLFYYIYPQTNFLVAYLTSAGVIKFIMNTNFSYAMASFNTVLSLLGFVSGFGLIFKLRHSFAVSSVVAAITLLVLSYGYLNTNTQYLLISAVLSFVSISLIAMGRMAATGASYLESSKSPADLDWPRLESF